VVFVSDSANAGDVGRPQRSSTPRALIHKKILEAAATMPEATMAEVADEVSGASTDLVERVLAEYGDPADSESDSGESPADTGDESPVDTGGEPPAETGGEPTVETQSESAEAGPRPDQSDDRVGTDDSERADAGGSETESETMTDDTPVRAPEELSDKELAVLEVVAERPDATQEEIADVLGVSRATISKRASGIEGFDWQRRATFVDRLFEDEADTLTRGAAESSTVSPSSLERADARTDGRSRANWIRAVRSTATRSWHDSTVSSRDSTDSNPARRDRRGSPTRPSLTRSSTPAWSPTKSPRKRSSRSSPQC
jgi:transcriptional regulator with XRE-family HTH domain